MYYTKLVPDRILIRMLLIYGYAPCLKYNRLEPLKALLLVNMLYLDQHMRYSSITILVIFHIYLKTLFYRSRHI